MTRKRIVIICLGLFLLILGGLVIKQNFHPSNSKARQFSDSFVSNILANKSSETYSQLSSDAQTEDTSDSWAAKVQKLSDFFKGSQQTYEATTNSSLGTKVTYKIEGPDGNYVLTVITKDQDGQSVVQLFNSELQAVE